MRIWITVAAFAWLAATGQNIKHYPLPAGVQGGCYLLSSPYAPFPDSVRARQPRVYNGVTYPNATHYMDSSLLVFVPDYFTDTLPQAIVFWFHGWYNHIDSSIKTFNLLQQFYGAGKNAVYIVPQGPYNAPDSYGGKWEYRQIYEQLWSQIKPAVLPHALVGIKEHGIHSKITLAGHSGAYRVMAKRLLAEPAYHYGSTVILLDGLYQEMDTYYQQILTNGLRFLHVYTRDGGTAAQSQQLMKQLDAAGIPYLHKAEPAITLDDWKKYRVIFAQSNLNHNQVVYVGNGLMKYLKYFMIGPGSP
ncbi:MAG TPA: hypothetical protein PKD90_08900 [Phnomibacter sp.]|nr:hypothetical protein [Phnomibacter sp.]